VGQTPRDRQPVAGSNLGAAATQQRPGKPRSIWRGEVKFTWLWQQRFQWARKRSQGPKSFLREFQRRVARLDERLRRTSIGQKIYETFEGSLEDVD